MCTAELHHPVKSFDENVCICKTCHKHLNKSEVPCQAVYNEMPLDPIPEELKDLKKLEKGVFT